MKSADSVDTGAACAANARMQETSMPAAEIEIILCACCAKCDLKPISVSSVVKLTPGQTHKGMKWSQVARFQSHIPGIRPNKL
jgi:3-oxoacyl-ACP reductase-like protein